MKGISNRLPLAIENIGNGYLVRWDIQEKVREATDFLPSTTVFEFEYNSEYLAKSVNKKEIMLAIIREKYDDSDEISILARRDGDTEKFQEHEDYVNFAREYAINIMSEHEKI